MREDIRKAIEQGRRINALPAQPQQQQQIDPVQQALLNFNSNLASNITYAESMGERSFTLSNEPRQQSSGFGGSPPTTLPVYGEDVPRFMTEARCIVEAAGLRCTIGRTPVQRKWLRRVGGGHDYIEVSW